MARPCPCCGEIRSEKTIHRHLAKGSGTTLSRVSRQQGLVFRRVYNQIDKFIRKISPLNSPAASPSPSTSHINPDDHMDIDMHYPPSDHHDSPLPSSSRLPPSPILGPGSNHAASESDVQPVEDENLEADCDGTRGLLSVGTFDELAEELLEESDEEDEIVHWDGIFETGQHDGLSAGQLLEEKMEAEAAKKGMSRAAAPSMYSFNYMLTNHFVTSKRSLPYGRGYTCYSCTQLSCFVRSRCTTI